jgi:nicotinate-nucleotide adenylyltransferase
MSMRIGLFGGTFNPVHFGHLRTVLEVRERFGLSRVYLIPSALPPHKSQVGIASPSDRLEMMRLAVANDSDFVLSDVELMRTGPSYTIDTLSYFANVLPETDPRFLIIGLDAFLEIHTWKDFMGILSRTPPDCHGKAGSCSPWAVSGHAHCRGRLS